jgi:hypothetical protein
MESSMLEMLKEGTRKRVEERLSSDGMDSQYYLSLASKNPDKNYPSNMGHKWTAEEDTTLLEEIEKGVDEETITEGHGRTLKGIHCRRKEIAYRMFLEKTSMPEIVEKTKLDEEIIRQFIDQKENYAAKKEEKKEERASNKVKKKNEEGKKQEDAAKKNEEIQHHILLRDDVKEMKNEIIELKTAIKGLVEMMTAVYDFEDESA